MRDDYSHSLDSCSREFVSIMHGLTLFLEVSFRFSIMDLENIPVSGPGILVMNHSAIPIDAMLLTARFLKEKGRLIRPLASKNLKKHLILRKIVALLGGVEANAVNALRLLKRGELILIYPGGPQEGIKDDRIKYKLIWGEEAGFIRLALLTGAPVIPVASIGLDDNFHLISDGLLLNKLIFGRDAFLLPIVRPRYIFPKKVTLYVGAPTIFPYPQETSKDIATVQKLQQQIKDVLENLISRHVKS